MLVVSEETQGGWGRLVLLDQLDPRETWELKGMEDHRERRENQELQEDQGNRVRKVCQESKVLQLCLG